MNVSRRGLLLGGGGLLAGGLVAGHWDRLSEARGYQPLLDFGDNFTRYAQRLAMWNRPLVREYTLDQLSKPYVGFNGYGNGIDPDPVYARLYAEGFESWRLRIGGLVSRPLELSLAELRTLPSRTQITMHSCVDGWNAIGQWTGVPLGGLLTRARILPSARYVVFYGMDTDRTLGINKYQSLDVLDAFHPQTLIAYALNGETLRMQYGAPVRLRIELQIGHKNLKHIDRIEVVDRERLTRIHGGRGGSAEDKGWQWYTGV